MSESVTQFLINIGTAILIAVVGVAISFLAKRLLSRILARFTNATWSKFVDDLAQVVIIGATLYFLLDRTGAAGVIVLILTAATAAFAIGSERIAGNFIAGFNLLAQNYYRVGDLVTIGEQQGIVTEITLSHTILKNSSRDRIIVPNAAVLNDVVINHTQIPGHYLKVSIPILRDHDRAEAIRLMQEAAAQYTPRLDGAQPEVFLEDFGAETSIYGVQVLIHESDKLDAPEQGRLRLMVAEHLKANGNAVGKLASE